MNKNPMLSEARKISKRQTKRLREQLKTNLIGENPETRTQGHHVNYWLSKEFIENPNLYIGSGYMHCPRCGKHTHHYALSHKVGLLQDNVLICKECSWGKYGG